MTGPVKCRRVRGTEQRCGFYSRVSWLVFVRARKVKKLPGTLPEKRASVTALRSGRKQCAETTSCYAKGGNDSPQLTERSRNSTPRQKQPLFWSLETTLPILQKLARPAGNKRLFAGPPEQLADYASAVGTRVYR